MKTRNPYANTKRRKAAIAFLKSRGITQPKAAYPAARFVDVTVSKARAARKLSIVS